MHNNPEECIFCKIIAGKIPSVKIYEDSSTIAILDIFPAAKGHALVLPKKHSMTLIEMEEKQAQEVMSSLIKVANAVVRVCQAQGFNIIQNNHKVAGQTVPHVHFHIVPRNPHDGLDLSFEKKIKYAEGEVEEIGKKIRGNLQ